MSIQPINIGQTANDGNGESLRDGGAKINANFAELDQRALEAATLIAGKVDKVQGLGLSETSFTQSEKTKLAGLESPHFRGTFATLAALVVGVAAPVPGDYADVDTAGEDAVRYIWDSTDSVWLAGGSSDSITAAQVKSLYESNPDTNPFTDGEQSKLGAIADGATANATNAQLRDRSTHTGSQLANTISDFSAVVRSVSLTGLSLLSGAAIVAGDTVLSALGKLQKQITDAATGLPAGVRGTTLEGLAAGTNAVITAGDTVLQALAKLQAQFVVMQGATAGAAGAKGLVPAPAAGDQLKVLTGAGVWADQSGGAFSKYYESAPTNWTANGELTFNHGLAQTPKLVTLTGIITSAQAGFPVGAKFSIPVYYNASSSVYWGAMVTDMTSTIVKVRMSDRLLLLVSSAGGLQALPAGSQIIAGAAS